MLTQAEIKINRFKSDGVPVTVILTILGHNWKENETWYFTQKIQYSLETKKKNKRILAGNAIPIFENITYKREMWANLFSLPQSFALDDKN